MCLVLFVYSFSFKCFGLFRSTKKRLYLWVRVGCLTWGSDSKSRGELTMTLSPTGHMLSAFFQSWELLSACSAQHIAEEAVSDFFFFFHHLFTAQKMSDYKLGFCIFHGLTAFSWSDSRLNCPAFPSVYYQNNAKWKGRYKS